jgi:hypothetical protein
VRVQPLVRRRLHRVRASWEGAGVRAE